MITTMLEICGSAKTAWSALKSIEKVHQNGLGIRDS